MNRLSLLVIAPLFALAACGGDADVVEQKTSTGASDKETKAPAEEQGSLLESGFGQGEDEYVGLAAIVKNTSDHAGQTVKVSFNVKDAAGKVLKTESQVDSFSWVGQELAVVTQTDLGLGEKAASVEATLLIEDDGLFETSDELATFDAKFAEGEYGNSVARVELTNPSSEILESPKVTAVCRDEAGKIAGSGFTFPDLIAPNGEYADDVDVIVTGKPAGCKIYLAPGGF